jgi:hypothetical protein
MPLLKVAFKLLSSDTVKFEDPTPQEQKFWSSLETDDTCLFLTGKSDKYSDILL